MAISIGQGLEAAASVTWGAGKAHMAEAHGQNEVSGYVDFILRVTEDH